MKYSFQKDARQELQDAASYYKKQGGNELAQLFIKEIHRIINLLLEKPDFGKLTTDGHRRCLAKRFPYTVIYAVSGSQIIILAIAHQQRKPDYWRGRG